MFQSCHVLEMKDDVWERVRELESMTWKGRD